MTKEIVEDYPNQKEMNKWLNRSLDKIMIANRNTKLFFVLMSGPFLVGFTLFKYLVKLTVLYFLYK